MTKKTKTTPPEPNSTDPAQQIWLAGLGAFSQAQKKSSEALQKMLQDGLQLQRQAQQTAEQKIADATEKMSAMAQSLSPGQGKANEMHAAVAPWGSLESLFEQRVVQALQRQGWATPEQFKALQDRVTALEKHLGGAPTPSTTRPARKTRNG